MTEKQNTVPCFTMVKEQIAPVRIPDSFRIENAQEITVQKEPCVSFGNEPCTRFTCKGAWILLDFGKELCGGLRLITREATAGTEIRITLGESLSEAYSALGEKNATNDHSPRDFTATLTALSDLTFGQSGFRFARVELLTDSPISVQSLFAEGQLPAFPREAMIKTSDRRLNKILETAAYTLKLNLQNGYIWDGIKRDRLVWSGDLHQEVITSLYLFGDNVNITNSLSFLRSCTPSDKWMNHIPAYSAWWVINLCDYCSYTNNLKYFAQNQSYAEDILYRFNSCIRNDGRIDFGDQPTAYFLDWPTYETPDSETGTAMIILIASKKYLTFTDCAACREIIKKLEHYLNAPCRTKQTHAFQVLAGNAKTNDCDILEDGGAAGFSTFMAYYILKADAICGGNNMLPILKEYFGAMLSRGATTFWEDFDLSWLNGSGRIGALPKRGQKDLHGDHGAFCYQGFRHSLCHGWSCGVVSFVIEHIFGIHFENGTKKIIVRPHKTCPDFKLKMPLPKGWLHIRYKCGALQVKAPEHIEVLY